MPREVEKTIMFKTDFLLSLPKFTNVAVFTNLSTGVKNSSETEGKLMEC